MDFHSSPLTLTQGTTPELVLKQVNQSLMQRVIELATSYPYPHSVLGGPRAGNYIEKLAERVQYPGEGWYAVRHLEEVLAAAHLCVYGVGGGDSHTLWKIRHPLVADEHPPECLTFFFHGLIDIAMKLRPGTAKFVIFLSEYEQEAMSQARKAGFEHEASFKDYYRLGETCFVYSRTVV
jgi:hypothetical protein